MTEIQGTIALVHEYFCQLTSENDISFLFLLLFQDGCSLVNGSPNNQQQQQQQQQLTLILLFGNHCRMGQSTQVKTEDYYAFLRTIILEGCCYFENDVGNV